ncbi:YCF48-related protein [Reichenbachiella agarivorans]|uniref:YCF48-related protein n=1 Tax=Reichenbachiella agarivorans TaxID=2979464 RepID=A0ABY6CUT2_9BACT|nr:YCF48-related protein [Reichenbachiella agarivorans]UXP33203.1 YCF48-related protein [Reichenbachiella agarivorans]
MKYLLIFISMITWEVHAQTVIDSTASLRGISVLNQEVVWVSGTKGTIAKTDDGGASWQKVVIPNTQEMDFRDIEVFDTKTVLVMSAGEGSKSNIYRSENAGKSWSLVYANTFEEGFFNGFSFSDSLKGVLTGDPIEGKLFVLRTTNGGKTWKRVNPKKLPEMADGEAGGFAASGSHLYLNDEIFVNGTGGSIARLYISDAGLKSWKAEAVPIIQGESSQGIFSIDFCNNLLGVAVGGDYTKEDEGNQNVVVTEDGGEFWIHSENFPVYQSSVRFVDCLHVVSTGPGGTYISNDSGYTWIKTNYPGFHAVDVSADGAIWVAGSQGRVMKLDL